MFRLLARVYDVKRVRVWCLMLLKFWDAKNMLLGVFSSNLC